MQKSSDTEDKKDTQGFVSPDKHMIKYVILAFINRTKNDQIDVDENGLFIAQLIITYHYVYKMLILRSFVLSLGINS
jgi:hypothetical protein